MSGTEPSDPSDDGQDVTEGSGTESSDSSFGAHPSEPASLPDDESERWSLRRESASQRVAPSRSPGSISMDPLIGRVIADRYEIIQRVGSGGMGSVYRARQVSVARDVALKVLRPDLINNDHIRQRFHREAEIIGRLSHPNTIRLYEFCTTPDGLAVMVMELLEGQPLSERLKSDGPMEMTKGLQVGIEVARALAEAHLVGLVHRDLKPANIFLHEVGDQVVTKVLDFGIARLMDEEATRLTVTDQVFGTPRYMSPEQGMSTASVDARSDIYSLGLILYECVVGQPPFVAQTSYQYLSAHSAQRPPKLRESVPTAPEPLERLIDACLEKQPDDRPQTAQIIAEQLEAIQRALTYGTALPPSLPSPVPTAPTIDGAATAGSTAGPTTLDADPEASLGPRSWGYVAAALAAAVVAIVVAGILGRAPSSTALDAGVKPVALNEPTPPKEPAPPPTKPLTKIEDDSAPKNPTATPKADAGVKPPKAPDKPRAERRRRRRQTPKQTSPDLVGPGTITGPRGLVIATEETQDDLLRIALGCKTSIFSGLSAITTRRCPSDCAILVDSTCAGLTPAKSRAIPPGRREVAVVCKGKVVRSATLRFNADDVTSFQCR
ncbi:MAG: serine/threonine-protein kinase [Myxococcota bacterium]